MSVRDRARVGAWLVLAMAGCNGDDVPPGTVRKAIGPDGGLIATEDDVLTLVIQPGALGEWIDLEIERTDSAPDAFGPAYRVRPNVVLEVYSEVIYRHDLPDDPSSATVGAIHIEDFEAGAVDWTPLPLEPGGLIVSEKTVHARDNQIALYYALLGEGGIADTGMTATSLTTSMTTSEDDSSSTGDVGPPVSYAADVQPIFTARCLDAACHDADAPANFLDLTDSAYDRIVAQAATGAPLTLITCGSPDDSYLFRKIDSDIPSNGTGGPMPPSGGPLTDEQIDTVRRWILQDCPT